MATGTQPPRLLILGGTGEGAALARVLAARFGERLWVLSSRAGRTRGGVALPGAQRAGGFGGAARPGAGFSGTNGSMASSTRPIRSPRGSRQTRVAPATRRVCPRLVVARPPWQQQPGDEWIEVADAAAAAARLPGLGRRAFLTVGAADLAAFASLSGVWCLVRLVDEPARSVPLTDYRLIVRRGPFDEAGEQALVCRQSHRCVGDEGKRRRGDRRETDGGARGGPSRRHAATAAGGAWRARRDGRRGRRLGGGAPGLAVT